MSKTNKERGMWSKLFGAIGALATVVETTAEAGVTASRAVNEYASSFEADAVNSFADNLELTDEERKQRLAMVEARKELTMNRISGDISDILSKYETRLEARKSEQQPPADKPPQD